jgi:hypothetical protein
MNTGVGRSRLNILGEDDHDDPILSVVNLIDVFLVIIAVLLIVVIENPLNPFAADDVVVIRSPGTDEMEMIVKQGEALTHFRSSGEIGEGKGIRAGVTYRLEDGSLIYVPEE